MAFTAWFARFEWTVAAPDPGDRVLHVVLANRAAESLAHGRDPTDHWIPEIACGYPLPHHYGHVPHVLAGALRLASGRTMAMRRVVGLLTWVCLVLWPLATYAGARRLGLARLAAGVAALLAPLASTDRLHGAEFGSVCAGGYGLFGQAFGQLLLPLAVGEAARACRTGRRVPRAAAWLALCGLCHLLSGYIAAVAVVVVGVVPFADARVRARRAALLAGLAALASAYHWLGIVRDQAHQNVSAWERYGRPEKLASRGHVDVLGDLGSGELLDHGRLPMFTALVALGIALALLRRRDRGVALLLALGATWLALYFGRPTWGALLDWLPFAGHLHLHRLIVGVHLAGAWLAGLAGGVLLAWALAPAAWWGRAVAGIACALLVLPLHRERAVSLAQLHRWQLETAAAARSDGADLAGLLDAVRRPGPSGRVYAGLAASWGRDYRVGHAPVYGSVPEAGLPSVGYLYHDNSYNGDLMLAFDEQHPAAYEFFDVRHAVVPAGRAVPPFYRLQGQYGRHAWYRIETPGPFALVDSELAAHGRPDAWYPAIRRWMQSGAAAAGMHPRLSIGAAAEPGSVPLDLLDATPLAPHRGARSGRGHVVAWFEAPGRYAAEVEVARPCWLMCRATYHPGWTAKVDGVAATPTMLAPAFLGIPLSPGRHEITLAYAPPWWRKWLLLLGVAGLVAAWIRDRRALRLTPPA